MNSKLLYINILFVYLISGFPVVNEIYGQEFLQIEIQNDPETVKFLLGQKVIIKTKQSDEWQTIVLRQFLYESNTIVYDQGFINLDDIAAIREHRQGVALLSAALMTFGGGWLVFGILGQGLDSKAEFGVREITIGVAALVTGWGLRKAFHNRDYVMGKRYRLRLLDLRMK